jgi:hypothetical protein
MSLNQAKVIDPILTQQVQIGPVQSNFIGNLLFPNVSVSLRSGRVIRFGDEAFALVKTRRAPGSVTNRRAVSYSSDRYELYQDKIEGELPIELLEETNNTPDLPIDLQILTVSLAKQTIDLRLEYDQLSLATSADAYATDFKTTLSGTSQWSDPASTPKANVTVWKNRIRRACGMYPNTMALGAEVFDNLDLHPEIREQFKYVSDNSLTIDMLKRYFNMERIGVSTALVLDETTGEKVDVMPDQVVLAYVNPDPRPNIVTPSFGYTYSLRGFPIVQPAYYGENEETWYFPVKAERAPVITFAGAGFLAESVV